MRIAYYSPAQLPQVLAYDRALLPALASQVEIERFVENGALAEVPAVPLLPTFEESAFPDRHTAAPYDLALYQIGDDPAYGFAFETLKRRPGIVDLQSLSLHRLYAPSSSGYEELLAAEYGEAGKTIGRCRAMGLAGAMEEALLPLGAAVASRALAAVVHTRQALAFLQQRLPALPVLCAPRPLAPEPALELGEGPALRARLGLRPEGLVLTSGGVLPLMRRQRLARAYRRLLAEEPAIILLIAAEDPLDALLWEEVLRGERLLGAARIADVGESAVAWAEVVAVTDIGLYLRAPAPGEMPELPLRLMAAGRPVVLLTSEALAEFPADCCAGVEPGAQEEELLLAYLRLLAGRPEVRQRLGENGRDYVASRHAPATVAAVYARFLEEVDRLLRERRGEFFAVETGVPRKEARPRLAGEDRPPAMVEEAEEAPAESGEPLDIEQILQEIRLKTGERYLTEQPPLPTFSAYRPPPAIRSEEERAMFASLGEANQNWELPEPTGPGNLRAYLLEVVRRQNRLNASLVRTLNHLTTLFYDPARDVQWTALRYEMAALYRRLEGLEKRLGLPATEEEQPGMQGNPETPGGKIPR